MRRVLPWLASAAIASYFFAFASPGLHSFWSHDDLANLSRVQAESISTVVRWNLEYFSPAYRPLGALYYRAIYEWFSLDPRPLRIVCFAFLLVEFWLIYAVTRSLTGSRETGAIATLLLCFHVNFEPMYYNSGMCYDVFCFLFYWTAFLYYVRIRRDREFPQWWQMIAIAALYICALNSKELAVTLPVILILWEFLFHGRKNLIRRLLPGIFLGVLTIPYLLGKLSTASVFAGQEPYKPVFSASNYWRETQNLLGEAFYLPDARRAFYAAIICIALLGGGLQPARGFRLALRRSAAKAPRGLKPAPHGIFCWFVMTIGILPIAFILPRGIPQAWVPALGLGIILASALVAIREKLFGNAAWSQAALFLATMTALAYVHIAHGARHVDTSEERVIRSVVNQLKQNHPPLPKGGKVLVLSDPFPEPFNLASSILICLYYHDPNLQITRLSHGDAIPAADAQGQFDWMVTLQ